MAEAWGMGDLVLGEVARGCPLSCGRLPDGVLAC